jgi:hypothetical protein
MKTNTSREAIDSLVVETKNGQVEWNLNSECRKVLIPIADEFGLSMLQFLKRYSHRRFCLACPSELRELLRRRYDTQP